LAFAFQIQIWEQMAESGVTHDPSEGSLGLFYGVVIDVPVEPFLLQDLEIRAGEFFRGSVMPLRKNHDGHGRSVAALHKRSDGLPGQPARKAKIAPAELEGAFDKVSAIAYAFARVVVRQPKTLNVRNQVLILVINVVHFDFLRRGVIVHLGRTGANSAHIAQMDPYLRSGGRISEQRKKGLLHGIEAVG
jgi:hypothetical protein